MTSKNFKPLHVCKYSQSLTVRADVAVPIQAVGASALRESSCPGCPGLHTYHQACRLNALQILLAEGIRMSICCVAGYLSSRVIHA